jgi:hypothetical protein
MRWPGYLNWRCIVLAIAVFLSCEPAFAEKRVALIIGNSAYQNAPQLPNPVNDAALMSETFKSAGFDVVDFRHDLSALETRRVLREFADRAQDADIAVVYYAGHGIEVDGTNYLSRSMPGSNATPMCSTRRCRWIGCWSRWNRQSSSGSSSSTPAATILSPSP